jgi:hypothetical protein
MMTELVAQLVALITFFAFPAFQYFLLKRYARKEGEPEFWYLPPYGFRLIVRNNPGTRTLSEIKYRAIVREVVPAGSGASVATFNDRILHEREDFFLFPNTDQVLLSFKLARNSDGLVLIYTDKLGAEQERISLSERAVVIADYVANLENFFNFDVKLAKRVELTAKDLLSAGDAVSKEDVENRFPITRVRDAG